MHVYLSRILTRLPFWNRQARPMNDGPDLPTEHIARKPLGWSKDGQTVKIQKSSTARLAWPARDRARSGVSQQANASLSSNGDDAPTRLVDSDTADATAGSRQRTSRAAAIPPDDDATRYVGNIGQSTDPVVGWLVVIEGPGRGNALQIFGGQNTIGRGSDQNLSVDFGDTKISRERHALLIYDPEARRYYLQAGDSRGLTYVDNNVVLTPSPLKGGEIITLGETKLKFVAFCGPQFSW